MHFNNWLQQFRINSNNSFSFCYPFPEQWGNEYAKTIVLARFLIYYAVPLCIIGIFYIMIARHLVYSASVPGEIQGAMRQVSYITCIDITSILKPLHMFTRLIYIYSNDVKKIYCFRPVTDLIKSVSIHYKYFIIVGKTVKFLVIFRASLWNNIL